MVGVKVEHVLILLIAAFVIYHLFESCGYTNGLVGVDGFSVGAVQDCGDDSKYPDGSRNPVDTCAEHMDNCNNLFD